MPADAHEHIRSRSQVHALPPLYARVLICRQRQADRNRRQRSTPR